MATKSKKSSPILESPILELKNVSKIYHLGNQTIKALDKINLTINQGDFISIVGSSGSGKSTFLQIASMLAEPTSGTTLLKSKDVTHYNEPERARLRNKEIGFIFQQFNLLPRSTALENVALPLIYANVDEKERLSKSKEVLKLVGLGDRLYNRPNQLSGGQQQRVAIARALVNEPSIVFADEPTGNLDSKTGDEIKKILKKLHQQGKTILMVTHEEELADIAEKTICLKDGKIIQTRACNDQK
ncbi:MAG: ABC transporter ATP-binding protein [Patescibacteria group bacterium]|nr:ABC transporter ATP-binding protein [Patescibacteria group bacterium]